MAEEKTNQNKVASYIGKVLRDNFGKGPTSVHVTLDFPFLIIHLRDFLAPMEAILIQQKEVKRVEETRDVLMEQLKLEIHLQLQSIVGIDIKELYFDWNLVKKTGMIIGILDENTNSSDSKWPGHLNLKQFNKRVREMSDWGQKIPEETESFWLNDRIIVIKRTGIFVQIEKELINHGFTEELKLVKRPMERRLAQQAHLEQFLDRSIVETFVDWDFNGDKGYMILVLRGNQQKQE